MFNKLNKCCKYFNIYFNIFQTLPNCMLLFLNNKLYFEKYVILVNILYKSVINNIMLTFLKKTVN